MKACMTLKGHFQVKNAKLLREIMIFDLEMHVNKLILPLIVDKKWTTQMCNVKYQRLKTHLHPRKIGSKSVEKTKYWLQKWKTRLLPSVNKIQWLKTSPPKINDAEGLKGGKQKPKLKLMLKIWTLYMLKRSDCLFLIVSSLVIQQFTSATKSKN